MIAFILGGRGSGKTTELIRKADQCNGHIVCHNQAVAVAIAEQARKMGCSINPPLTYRQVRDGDCLRGRQDRRLHVDNVEMFLQFVVPGADFQTCTTTPASLRTLPVPSLVN